ncbi:hypothetical protein V6N11_051969 [Hibiscus sabdariffa]|uniref:Uncharacterized protein n=1 Tax=Hibiscus sabdariffa TaxID=183260 RepID=A0ABR2U9F3_9ROSI
MLSWNADEMNRDISRQSNIETMNNLSDNEVDDELNSKRLPPRVIKYGGEPNSSTYEKHGLGMKPELLGQGGFRIVNFSATSNHLEDLVGMLPEWTPSNVSVPLLNLIDKVFHLKRRGWLRGRTLFPKEFDGLKMSQRTINLAQAAELEIVDRSRLAPKESVEFLARNVVGIENLGLIPEDYSNYLCTKRTKEMRVEDTGGVLEYLQNMQHEDPNFSYAIQVVLCACVECIALGFRCGPTIPGCVHYVHWGVVDWVC